jgi:redox-sensitive bicupin YhaK (pirin superfamily)
MAQRTTPPTSPNTRPALLEGVAAVDGAGARVQRILRGGGHHRDPFVLLDHFAVAPPAGFPMHPHRGFEAFTYMLDGAFEHRDNLGNNSAVATHGVQVFTSGRGAWHSEMPGTPTTNRGLQLWVNLPRSLKAMPPRYAAVRGQDLPESHRRGVQVRTVVGPGSPVQLQTPVRYLDLTLERGSAYEDALPTRWKGLLLGLEGEVRVGDVTLPTGQTALVDAGELGLRALSRARVVLVAGLPHDEPITHHGPFVD